MKKSILSLLLAIVFVFGATEGAVSAFAETKRNEDTPVAEIEENDYKKDLSTANKEQCYNLVKKEIESYGGYLLSDDKTENGQDEYVEYALVEEEIIQQVIKVQTTATGSKEHDNYVESKPIANAIVRINGVPRFTDRAGKIKVHFEKGEHVELFVEMDGYNPYIEIMEITGDEKVVHLKKPSDDIDVYGAVVNYLGQDFDVFKKTCFLNTSLMQNYFYLTVYSNLQADAYYLLINGKKVCYSSTGTFQRIAFFNRDYSIKEDDVFQLQVYYEGIESKVYDLNIKVVKTFINLNKILQNLSFDLVDAGKMEFGDNNFTDLGSIDTSFNKSIINKFVESINKTGAAFNVGNASIKLEYLYFPETAEIQYSVGFSYKFKNENLKKLEEKLNTKFIENEKRKKKISEIESDIAKAQEEIDKINKKINQSNTNQENYEKIKKEAIAKYEKKLDELKENMSDPNFIENEEQIKVLQGQYNANIRRYNRQAEKRNAQISQLNTEIASGKAGIEKLNNMFTKVPEITKKANDLIGIIQNGPPTGGGFKVKSAVEFMGVVTFNLDTGLFKKAEVTVGVKVDLSFTWQGVFFYVPVFFKITGSGEVKAKLVLNPMQTFSFSELIRALNTILEFALRIDAGVGISGLASVSVFGSIGIEFDFSWGSALIDQEQPFEITFKYGYGMRFEFLWFEHEISHYESKPILERSSDSKALYAEAKLMARSNLLSKTSSNQKFANVFQNSNSKILELDGREYIFWLEDSLNRDDYNRTILNYSVCENGIWSKPFAVNDDGRGDLNFDIVKYNGDLYVAYQKSNKIFNETSDVDEVLRSQEIFVAKYNSQSNSFVNYKITNNNEMDVLPQFAIHDNDKLYLTWMSNSNNDAFGLSGNSMLFYSSLINDNWTKPIKYFETDEIIKSWSSAVIDNNLGIAVSLDMDGDLTTLDSKIKNIGMNNEIIIEEAFNPILLNIDGAMSLYYCKDNNLYTIIENNKEINLGSSKQFGIDYCLEYSNNQLFVIYEKIAGENKQSFFSVFNFKSNEWTIDISVVSESGNMYGTNLLLTGDKMLFSYNLQDESFNTVLCEVEKILIADIEIRAVNYFGKIEDNVEIDLCIEVFNGGDIDLKNLKFELFNQTIDMEIPSKLCVGESRNLFLTVVPKLVYNCDETIVVFALSEDGTVLANDEYILNTTSTDIEILVSNCVKNEQQVFEVQISNLSIYDTNAKLNVYCNGEIIKEISMNVKGEQVIFNEYHFENLKKNDYIYFEIETERKDAFVVNNKFGLLSLIDSKTSILNQNEYQETLTFAKGLI